MPEADAVTGGDLDSIVRGAMAPPPSVDVPKIQAKMTDVAEQQAKASAGIAGRMGSDVNRDLSRIHRAEAGIEPVPEMKWDADAERKKYTTDPMESFGSLGFIAVTLASAFTRQPMINTLNSAGAYLGAVNDVNNRNYDKAYEAFKENATLALKRHETQREAFDDALRLMQTDISAGKAMMEANAIKFGDKRAQALMEGGYFKELIDYQNSQRESYMRMAELMPKLDAERARRGAADEMRDKGASNTEIYHSLYAPAYSNTLANLKLQKFQQLRSQFPDKQDGELWAEVEKTFPTGRAAQQVPAATLTQEAFENLKKQHNIEIDPATQAAALGVMSEKGARSSEGKAAFANAMSEINARFDAGEQLDSKAASQIVRDAMADASTGQATKIDPFIRNELSHYKETKLKDLLGMGTVNQNKAIMSFNSVESIETIASFAAANPEAIGLIADSARRTNWDAYEGLFKDFSKLVPRMDVDGVKKFAEGAAAGQDQAIDAAAKRKGLSQDVAEKAKVLNKMLATQAFADAAAAGSRGATIYLDKAFREIYQQASSPPAFFDILHTRQDDADRQLSHYKLGLEQRDDYEKKFGFHSNPEKYLKMAVKPKGKTGQREAGKSYPNQTPNPAYPIWGGDGKWYSEDEWKQKNAH